MLKVSTWYGLSPKLFQIRQIVDLDKPVSVAIDARDQCVALAGVASKVLTITSSIRSSSIARGAPGRGSSARPSRRLSKNRVRHVVTVWGHTPNSAATSVFDRN